MSTDALKKKRGTNKFIGDWRLFLRKLAEYLFKFLVVVSIGSIIISVLPNDFEEMFPTDQDKEPYCWTGCDPKGKASVFNFPYQKTAHRPRYEKDITLPWIAHWYEYVCMKAFITTRMILKSSFGKFATLEKDGNGWVVFYVVSLLVYLSMFNPLVKAGVFAAFTTIGSIIIYILTFYDDETHRYMWSLFPLYFMAKYFNLSFEALGQGNILSSMGNMIFVFGTLFLGFVVFPFNLFFIYCVACCALVYVSIVIPYLGYTSGFRKCFDVIKSYRRSICAVVTVIIMFTTYKTLNFNVAIGTMLVGFYLLYTLYMADSAFVRGRNKVKVKLKAKE